MTDTKMSITEALEWYRDEAASLSRHIARNGAASNAVLASVTVLSLDGGHRANSALAALAQQAAVPAAPDAVVELLMEQAQVFASAWAIAGGRFDSGDGLEHAEAM